MKSSHNYKSFYEDERNELRKIHDDDTNNKYVMPEIPLFEKITEQVQLSFFNLFQCFDPNNEDSQKTLLQIRDCIHRFGPMIIEHIDESCIDKILAGLNYQNLKCLCVDIMIQMVYAIPRVADYFKMNNVFELLKDFLIDHDMYLRKVIFMLIQAIVKTDNEYSEFFIDTGVYSIFLQYCLGGRNDCMLYCLDIIEHSKITNKLMEKTTEILFKIALTCDPNYIQKAFRILLKFVESSATEGNEDFVRDYIFEQNFDGYILQCLNNEFPDVVSQTLNLLTKLTFYGGEVNRKFLEDGIIEAAVSNFKRGIDKLSESILNFLDNLLFNADEEINDLVLKIFKFDFAMFCNISSYEIRMKILEWIFSVCEFINPMFIPVILSDSIVDIIIQIIECSPLKKQKEITLKLSVIIQNSQNLKYIQIINNKWESSQACIELCSNLLEPLFYE